jgi:hypothetical protein
MFIAKIACRKVILPINYDEMEIRDNTFSRQFETTVDGQQLTAEYSLQDRKIFLTRLSVSAADEQAVDEFIRNILELAIERKLKVVPTFPRIASFFRKNPAYKEMLPPGIRI